MNAPQGPPTNRICFVTDDFAGAVRNGGIGTHFLLMGRLLARRGWHVHVMYCGPVESEAAMAATRAQLATDGVSFSLLDDLPAPVWHGVEHFGDSTATLVNSQRAFEALELLHAEHRYDIIEFSDWRALGFRSVQAKRGGMAFADVHLAVKLHSTSEWQRRGNLENRESPWELQVEYCERYAFEHADLQLSPSNYMLADAREQGWAVRDDAVVAYPFPARQADTPSPAGDVRELVFFGRLERRKGLDLFLDALDRLDEQLPVLFLGRDSLIEGRQATDIVSERLGDRPHRIETGLDRDEAIAELLRGDRLAVIASRSESFGFTVAECIVDEIPFLASRAGGIPEVVAHDEARARWLFEPTVDGLAAALRRRLSAPAEEERQLRAAVAAACDPDRWNSSVEAAYGELAARPARGRSSTVSREGATVTVAVTHHEHPDFLPSALASLAAQTRRPDEVLVIDDGSSTDEARRAFDAEEARYPDWTFLRQENAGPGAARNACLARAQSTFFLPFDSDNVATPELIETLLTAALTDGRDAATCHALAFTEERDIAAGRFAFRYAPLGGPRIATVLDNVFGDTCGLFRADALRAVGGFETERWSPHEDWETYTKLAFGGYRVDVAPRVLFYYRTDVGGRLDELAGDPARGHRLRRRMIRDLLADRELEREECIALWECLLAFADPSYELERVTRELEDLDEWSRQEVAELNAWRERELAELRSWLTAELDQATARAAQAEAEAAELRSRVAEMAARAVDARMTVRRALRRALADRRRRGR